MKQLYIIFDEKASLWAFKISTKIALFNDDYHCNFFNLPLNRGGKKKGILLMKSNYFVPSAFTAGVNCWLMLIFFWQRANYEFI